MFETDLVINLSVTRREDGMDEMKVNPVIPPEILRLGAEEQVKTIESCITALSRVGMLIMQQHRLTPKTTESSEHK